MTNKEFWIRLFIENDVALIAAITLCMRFYPSEEKPLTESQIEFIKQKKEWLNEKVSGEDVKAIFGEKAI